MAPKTNQQEKFVEKFLRTSFSSSILSLEDVQRCRERLNLPDRYSVRKPKADEFPNSRLSKNEIVVYYDQIRLGLKFSKFSILEGILNHYKISLAMTTPNFFCTVILIYYFCQIRNIPWSIDVYLYLFSLRGSLSYVASKPRNKTFITDGLTSSIHDWKIKYVIVQAPMDWKFPNYPEVAAEDVLQIPECPKGLFEWFKANPLPYYIVENRTKDLMSGARAANLMGKKAEVLSKRKRKEKIASTSRTVEGSSDDVDLEDDPDCETSSSSKNNSKPSGSTDKSESSDKSADINIIDSDEVKVHIERPTAQGFSPYYFNDAGDMVIRKNSNLSLLEEPCNPFGPFLFKHLECPDEIKKYNTMGTDVLEQIYSNSMITAGRLGCYFLNTAMVNGNTAERCKKVYDAAVADLKKAKEKILSLEQGEGLAAKRLEMVTDELKMANECLDAALLTHTDQEVKIKELTDKNKELTDENLKLKEALSKKDATVAVHSVGEASTSGRSLKERFEDFRDTDVFQLEMDSFLNQGFEKFRRASFRRFKDAKDVSTLQSIDYYISNDEDFADLYAMMDAEDEVLPKK